MARIIHSLIQALIRHLWSAGAGEIGARREQGPGYVGGAADVTSQSPICLNHGWDKLFEDKFRALWSQIWLRTATLQASGGEGSLLCFSRVLL